jgi:hypothetical protein
MNIKVEITAVIYYHSMVILSLCVVKLFYLGNYHGMAANYCVFYPRKSKVKITAVICCIVL